MPSYCCFCCPKLEHTEKRFDDVCPSCGRRYDFPLLKKPTRVKQFEIVRSLDRGFYSAAYVAESGALGNQVVLKVAPKNIYSFFGKNFAEECRQHNEVARDTEHIVRIQDMFDTTVNFEVIALDCHVAVLEFVEGDSLSEYLSGNVKVGATSAAQIAIDLLQIRTELENKGVYHNDLQPGNIIVKRLSVGARRANAIDESLRAVAIDLGSAAEASKSSPAEGRRGDLHWIAAHITGLVNQLLQNPDHVSDLDHRLAAALHGITDMLLSPRTDQVRTPASADLIKQIIGAYKDVSLPWREPLRLEKFSDSYNAQTLAPWHVPQLLVDPDGKWFAQINGRGPQVITGMRGCGKTMLLRALQFHARITAHKTTAKDDRARLLSLLADDRFLGLYAPSQRLLDLPDAPKQHINVSFARLFLRFAQEAIDALSHLQDLDQGKISARAHIEIGEILDSYLRIDRNLSESIDLVNLRNKLLELQIKLSKPQSEDVFRTHPVHAFQDLAQAIKRCSSIWSGSYVLFLLDDVSTRYLTEDSIGQLLSALIFQSADCAFKITSEAQTLELALRSPGQIEAARAGRDYGQFDLGAEVYEKIKERGIGKAFVEQILSQRSKYYPIAARASPAQILGDTNLEEIARHIAQSVRGAKERKKTYHGLNALARVCVGDIGDIISLYETILNKVGSEKGPASQVDQSECFQAFCAQRLYLLSRNQSDLKDIAESFAEASHELLMKSSEDIKAGRTKRKRLRQYLTIYVRITSGDKDRQYQKLRELVDSGVFVFAGGGGVPRAKGRDSNPAQQFKLTFRKILGLHKYIGLAESDRFELSGKALENWLFHPDLRKKTLLDNQATDNGLGDTELQETGKADENQTPNSEVQPGSIDEEPLQGELPIDSRFEAQGEGSPLSDATPKDVVTENAFLKERMPRVTRKSLKALAQQSFSHFVLGLGFEERTLASAERCLTQAKCDRVLLVRYEEEGKSKAIIGLVKKYAKRYAILDYADIIKDGLCIGTGNCLIDVTGLAKPIMFFAIRDALISNRAVTICHTRAQTYYPLDKDLKPLLSAERGGDQYAVLLAMDKIITGEYGPYSLKPLLSHAADESRRAVLCAFASPKHERLLDLLGHFDYSRIEVGVPTGNSPRSKLAQIVGQVAVSRSKSAELHDVPTNDLSATQQFLERCYQRWYLELGFNFELGLTGSKLQAACCAVFSSAMKVSQVWYVSPQRFDKKRFTTGVGDTTIFEISLDANGDRAREQLARQG